MNNSATVDEVVREVLRRLAAIAAPAALTTATASAESRDDGQLLLTDRLVTLATLEGRLDGVKVVQVNDKAVVTPLVRDELRHLGIRLNRVTRNSTAASATASTDARRVFTVAGACGQWLSGSWRTAQRTDVRHVGELKPHLTGRPKAPVLVITASAVEAIFELNGWSQLRILPLENESVLREAINGSGFDVVVANPAWNTSVMRRQLNLITA